MIVVPWECHCGCALSCERRTHSLLIRRLPLGTEEPGSSIKGVVGLVLPLRPDLAG